MSNRYSSPSDHFLSKATSAGPWQRPHMASDNASLPSLRHSSYITRPKTSGKRRHRWAKSQSSYDDDDNHHHEGITMSQDLPRYAHNKIYRKSTVARTSFTSRLLLLIAKQARQRWLIALIGLLLLVLALLYKRAAWIPSGDMLEEDKSSSIRIPPSVADQVAMLDLNPRPISRAPSGRKDEKYMAYFPHSGYHNQRISLENALVVAKMLNRTLLVPPVWLGHSIPYISFDKLYHRVREARKDGLEHCKDIEWPNLTPHECLGGYWDYTIVSWDFLVDLERVGKTQPLIERWDMSYNWLEENLGIDVKKDMVKVKDSTLYQYRIYDSENDTTPLDKFRSRLDIPKLQKDYADVKLLHFGTLFGTTRVHLLDKENYAARSLARSSMVFKNEYLDKVSNMIKERLGGDMAYFGVHLRLGDGVFRDNAASNAEKLFKELCEMKIGISLTTLGRILGTPARATGLVPRVTEVDENLPAVKNGQGTDSGNVLVHNSSQIVIDGQEKQKRKIKVDPHLSLPPLQRISSLEESPLHTSLRCRKPLYTEDDLLLLNTPIFLATDSNMPDKDLSLKIFFDIFPCIFTLSDFSASKPTPLNTEPILAFEELNRLRNEEDGVPFAKFFYPLIDAMVAAKGRDMLGTPGSTFSQFAVDVLHRVYHDWPIVERG